MKEYQEAINHGFKNKDMYLAYKRSGFQAKEEFDRFLDEYKQKIPKLEKTIVHCMDDAQKSLKEENFSECYRLQYTALEKKVEKTYFNIMLSPQPDDVIEKIIKNLEDKKQSVLIDQTEMAYWRRARNKIIHDNYKIDNHTLHKGLFFIEDLISKLNKIDVSQDWLNEIK